MKLKLLGKVLLFTLIPIILGFAVLTFMAAQLTSSGLYKTSDIQLLEFAKKQASEIDNIFKNVIALADMLDSDQDIEDFTARANSLGQARDSDYDFTARKKITEETLAELCEDFPDVVAAAIVAKDGKTIAASSPSSARVDVSRYPSVVEAFSGKANFKTNMSKTTNKLSIMVTSPITVDGSNELADGVLLLVVDLNAVADDTIKSVTLMPSSSVFLVDADGIMLMEKSFPELIGKDNSIYEYIRTVLAEKNGITRYEWEGVDKLTHFAELPTTKWIVGIETDESDFYTTSNGITLILAFISIGIVFIVALIVYFVIKKVVVVVSQSANIATYVAEGNLKLTAEQDAQIDAALKREDEFSNLGAAFRAMINNLAAMVVQSEEKSKEAQVAADNAAIATKQAEKSAAEAEESRKNILIAVTKLEGIVNNIASASEQLSAQIEMSTSGAEEQSARMTETATAMDEMNGTVLEVARNSGTSAELADNTKAKAIDGANITQKCQVSMTHVKDESLKLRQNMSELASHAQSISAVMSVISDIADQTNLLALNAAIEAARAGEAGRGFAVVADEVRKLAEKTISSTTDVANAINAIQQSTEVNVQQVDTAVARIEEATELAIEGGHALQGILEMAEHSADEIRAIATASEQQSATSDEIAQSIMTVTNIATNTVNAMNEATQAVASLTEQAQQLAALVENLKNS